MATIFAPGRHDVFEDSGQAVSWKRSRKTQRSRCGRVNGNRRSFFLGEEAVENFSGAVLDFG